MQNLKAKIYGELYTESSILSVHEEAVVGPLNILVDEKERQNDERGIVMEMLDEIVKNNNITDETKDNKVILAFFVVSVLIVSISPFIPESFIEIIFGHSYLKIVKLMTFFILSIVFLTYYTSSLYDSKISVYNEDLYNELCNELVDAKNLMNIYNVETTTAVKEFQGNMDNIA